MKRAHLVFGAIVVIAFLLTGQYMDKFHNHLTGMADGQRLLFRTRHIFILLAGLLNLGIGAYFVSRAEWWRKVLQLVGSGLIMAASLLFIVAFFYEPTLSDLETPFSHWAAYAIVGGTLLHVVVTRGAGHSQPATAARDPSSDI